MGRNFLKEAWDFVWYGDSWASWWVNLALAFIIIKFIVYPVLGWMLGTGLPVVAVVSESMEHSTSIDNWWATMCHKEMTTGNVITQGDLYRTHGISVEGFKKFSFTNGFNKGDIMILYSPKSVSVGDVIVFPTPDKSEPIIHRVVSKYDTSYTTKGDNNCVSASFEQNIPKQNVIGKAVLRIPFLGWVKIWFVWLVQFVWGLIGGVI